MQLILAIVAAVTGLFVTGAVVFTCWFLYAKRNAQKKSNQPQAHLAEMAGEHFRTWTIFDVALLLMMILGLLFLLADLVAVLRDRDLYPSYHVTYLLSGFCFILIGTLLILTRFILMTQASTRLNNTSSQNNHHEPKKTQSAK